MNTTLGALLGSSYINDFNRFGRVYKVYVQAEPEFRRIPAQLGLFFVRNKDGASVPLDTLVTHAAERGTGVHESLQPVPHRGADGRAGRRRFSSAQALDALEEMAREVLPGDMSHDWADMSYQERKAPGVAVVFALAILLVFLILAAQYQSWGLPFSVLLGTPFAAFGAYLGLWLARQYSRQLRQQRLRPDRADHADRSRGEERDSHRRVRQDGARAGKGLVDAALNAAKLRFRPILMTAFAFILGVVPLLTASGAGAEARKVMGMTVFSGMLVATILGVCLIPMLFVVVQRVIGGAARVAHDPARRTARHCQPRGRVGTEMPNRRRGSLQRSSSR